MKKYVGEFIAAVREWQRSEENTKLPMIRDEYSNATRDGGKQNVDPKTGASQNEYGTLPGPCPRQKLTSCNSNHPWFKEATEFAMQLREIHKPDLKKPKVKVAVIDDGVSPTYQGVGQYLHHPGWPHQGERAQETFTSTNGNGSKMAYLITRICPFAEIYVAKLDADTSNFQENTFSLHAAKKVSTDMDWDAECVC